MVHVVEYKRDGVLVHTICGAKLTRTEERHDSIRNEDGRLFILGERPETGRICEICLDVVRRSKKEI